MGRFPLDRVENFVDRQHSSSIVPAGNKAAAAGKIRAWRDQFFTGNRPEPRAATPEVIWTSSTSTWKSTISTKNRRRPVFKERPLPKSKKEAIDLMMEQPNLIRRPILIQGSKVTFGFDKEAYPKSRTTSKDHG
jgi:ArsC family protein